MKAHITEVKVEDAIIPCDVEVEVIDIMDIFNKLDIQLKVATHDTQEIWVSWFEVGYGTV